MADKEIPDLTDGGAVANGDVGHVFRSPNSRKATFGDAAGKNVGTSAGDVADGAAAAAHYANTSNPHSVTKAQVGLGNVPNYAEATAAEYRNKTASRLLSPDKVWDAAEFVTITDAATLSFDMNAFGYLVQTTLGDNRTAGDPSNVRPGKHFAWKLTATGATRTFALHADYKVAAGVETFPISVTTSETVFVYGFGESADIVRITSVQRFS